MTDLASPPAPAAEHAEKVEHRWAAIMVAMRPKFRREKPRFKKSCSCFAVSVTLFSFGCACQTGCAAKMAVLP